MTQQPTGTPMNHLPARGLSRNLPALLVVGLLTPHPTLAADDPDAPKGPAVTVLKAAKSCFSDVVEVSGIVLAREETMVRPERLGLKVAEVLADAGDSVTAGQTLARLTLPEGGMQVVQAPVAGTIASSSAQIGGQASGRGEALFTIISRSEYDLVGLVPTSDLTKLQVGQTARIKIVGVPNEVTGRVRRVAPTVQPDSQLGQVFIALAANQRLLINSSGRAGITTGQSCNNVAVPLTSVLYGSARTAGQLGKQARVENNEVEVGLMDNGRVEISKGVAEGDIVVARAGALLREGDPVGPVMTGDGK